MRGSPAEIPVANTAVRARSATSRPNASETHQPPVRRRHSHPKMRVASHVVLSADDVRQGSSRSRRGVPPESAEESDHPTPAVQRWASANGVNSTGRRDTIGNHEIRSCTAQLRSTSPAVPFPPSYSDVKTTRYTLDQHPAMVLVSSMDRRLRRPRAAQPRRFVPLPGRGFASAPNSTPNTTQNRYIGHRKGPSPTARHRG